MSRKARLHVPGGFYYVSHRCTAEHQFFTNPEDYAKLNVFIAAKLKSLRMRAHAYCWLPREIHLLVEVSDIPVIRLMRPITNHLAYRSHLKPGESSIFDGRHRLVVVDPEEYLLEAIRFIHWRSVDTASTNHLNGYEHSSHLCYCGLVETPWLTTHEALNLLNLHTGRARPAYMEFMQSQPTEKELQIFTAASSLRPCVAGSSFFSRRVGAGLPIRPATTLETLAESISKGMACDLAEVRSSSRRRELSRVRAVIAWHATQRKIASLAEVARYLGRKPPSMCSAIDYYSARERDLFDLKALPIVTPIVPVAVVTALLERPVSDDHVDDIEVEHPDEPRERTIMYAAA